MSNITHLVLSKENESPKEVSPFISESAKIFFSTQQLKTQLIEEHLKLLNSSIPVISHQDTSLSQLAILNKQIESLKSVSTHRNKLEKAHRSAVISCLFNQISEITSLIKQIQIFKQKTNLKIEELESARKISYQSTPIRSITKPCNEYPEESQELLQQLTDQKEELLNTQRQVSELNSIMSFFAQKLHEQEETTHQILEDALSSLNSIVTARSHLTSANEHSKGQEKWWIAYFLTLIFCLLIFEWWNTKTIYVNK